VCWVSRMMIRERPITLSLPQLACIFLPQEMQPLGTDQKLQLPAQRTKHFKILFEHALYMGITKLTCSYNFFDTKFACYS
jgi:hypothetical protein